MKLIVAIQGGGTGRSISTLPLLTRTLYTSVTTQEELLKAPNEVKSLVKLIKSSNTEFLDLNFDIIQLANEYISN